VNSTRNTPISLIAGKPAVTDKGPLLRCLGVSDNDPIQVPSRCNASIVMIDGNLLEITKIDQSQREDVCLSLFKASECAIKVIIRTTSLIAIERNIHIGICTRCRNVSSNNCHLVGYLR